MSISYTAGDYDPHVPFDVLRRIDGELDEGLAGVFVRDYRGVYGGGGCRLL